MTVRELIAALSNSLVDQDLPVRAHFNTEMVDEYEGDVEEIDVNSRRVLLT